MQKLRRFHQLPIKEKMLLCTLYRPVFLNVGLCNTTSLLKKKVEVLRVLVITKTMTINSYIRGSKVAHWVECIPVRLSPYSGGPGFRSVPGPFIAGHPLSIPVFL